MVPAARGGETMRDELRCRGAPPRRAPALLYSERHRPGLLGRGV